MADQTIHFIEGGTGTFVDMIYPDTTMRVTSIHIIVPLADPALHFHLITRQPNRTIDQVFQPGTDQFMPPGVNLPIVIVQNQRGNMVPEMAWLVEFGIGG